MNPTPFKLGWHPDWHDSRDFKYATPPTLGAVPGSVRLVWVPGALQQNDLGSCVANAISGAVTYDRIKQRKLHAWAPSRLFTYYNARAMRGWEGFDSGAYIRDGIKSVVTQGTVKEEDWPYDVARFTEKPADALYEQAFRERVMTYHRISHSLDDMKACLAEGFPFIFGFTVYNDFAWNDKYGQVQMPGRSTYAIGGHAVLAVAYDDGGRRFEFLNSWGQEWGKHGRGTIPYEYLTDPDLSDDFWTIRTVQ